MLKMIIQMYIHALRSSFFNAIKRQKIHIYFETSQRDPHSVTHYLGTGSCPRAVEQNERRHGSRASWFGAFNVLLMADLDLQLPVHKIGLNIIRPQTP